MRPIKKLYACIDTETLEFQGFHKYRKNKYAYCMRGKCEANFHKLLMKDSKYQIVELIPQYPEEELVCHAQ